ncbi:flagellar basal body-associated FliL family protein [Ostreiculturibacter nitratireducens]|uniref:flagellar basal body-associated FliL family protein n=1 Tax=Ostreiculturibacter nitratireducens TaxID=3075226 RepID=UPI0031B62F75
MRKIAPLILALFGLGVGTGGGLLLRPAPEEVVLSPCGDGEAAQTSHSAEKPGEDGAQTHDYVKLNNQFVVPVVENGQVTALVILSLSLEVTVGATQEIYALEPKLRDGFLQILFDHANAGGFSGAFTDANNMTILRHSLLESARKVSGETISDVLIIDIVRQDA